MVKIKQAPIMVRFSFKINDDLHRKIKMRCIMKKVKIQDYMDSLIRTDLGMKGSNNDNL